MSDQPQITDDLLAHISHIARKEIAAYSSVVLSGLYGGELPLESGDRAEKLGGGSSSGAGHSLNSATCSVCHGLLDSFDGPLGDRQVIGKQGGAGMNDDLTNRLDRLDAKLDAIAEDIVLDDARVAALDSRLAAIEKRLASIEEIRRPVVTSVITGAGGGGSAQTFTATYPGGAGGGSGASVLPSISVPTPRRVSDRERADLIRAAAEAMSAALADFLLLAMKGN